jgi:hypothetical protein
LDTSRRAGNPQLPPSRYSCDALPAFIEYNVHTSSLER